MRSTKKASFYLFTAAFVLVPAAAITACGDDDTTTPGPTTLLDGSASDARTTSDSQVTPADSGGQTDSQSNPIDSGHDDASVGDAGADADADASTDADADAGPEDSGADADASADADADTKPTSVPDGTYKITAWTCTPAGGGAVKDVLGFTTGIGMAEIDFTIATTPKLEVLWSGGDCVRTNTILVTYPQAGQITTTTTVSNTCSGTCTESRCNPATVNPVYVDTFDFTTATSSFTATRTFPASAAGTLASAASCATGDTESATYTKK